MVGGASSRMGTPKGLLNVGTERLLERTVRVAQEAGLDPVLVGKAHEYASLLPDVARIDDGVADAGPIGGLAALLGPEPVIVVGCDMPYIEAEDLRRLGADPRNVDVVAPRALDANDWEPLFARYAPSVQPKFEAYLQTGRRSLRGLLDRCEVAAFEIDATRLRDWDSPADRVP